jgi:hypothetical protein
MSIPSLTSNWKAKTWKTIKETTRRIQSWGRNRSFIGLTLWREEEEADYLIPCITFNNRKYELRQRANRCNYSPDLRYNTNTVKIKQQRIVGHWFMALKWEDCSWQSMFMDGYLQSNHCSGCWVCHTAILLPTLWLISILHEPRSYRRHYKLYDVASSYSTASFLWSTSH